MGEAAEVMRRELEAVNRRDSKTIAATFSPECVKLVPGARLQGGDQVAAWCAALFDAFPDFEISVGQVVEQGALATVNGTVTGTQTGTLRTPGGDIPASGRRAEVPYSETAEVRGGVVVAAQLFFDRLELLEQLGTLAAPANA